MSELSRSSAVDYGICMTAVVVHRQMENDAHATDLIKRKTMNGNSSYIVQMPLLVPHAGGLIVGSRPRQSLFHALDSPARIFLRIIAPHMMGS